jgi:hypothetical protein
MNSKSAKIKDLQKQYGIGLNQARRMAEKEELMDLVKNANDIKDLQHILLKIIEKYM